MSRPTTRPPHPQELTLEWIPLQTRHMLDQAAVRISLWQWQKLPLADRQLLARMAESPTRVVSNFLQVLESALASADAGEVRVQPPPDAPLKPPDAA